MLARSVALPFPTRKDVIFAVSDFFHLRDISKICCGLCSNITHEKSRGLAPRLFLSSSVVPFYEVSVGFLLIDTDSFDDRISVFVLGDDINAETFQFRFKFLNQFFVYFEAFLHGGSSCDHR